ncbi:efflux RND transporter periplasmic adaptor subunit [Cochlodiniinecator piscidefendens]|uniref:efflux RND transporter periplasmic adaptor subunit n=1 Tax=Cochlodiniinecator piscidefendens TaxID=2715756 RepID=UPI00140DF176|nr:efflux RND transporter periplasmic adaptor subunit [Cochlodiniinecator piscidefendens]
MRLFPFLTALLVSAVLYGLIMERDTLFALASGQSMASESTLEEGQSDPSSNEALATAPQAETGISVVALRSTAQVVDSAVELRGQTEADRQVEVRSETAGLVQSHPIRKGAEVEAGQLLCQISPGTRAAQLAEANARLAEAQINFTAAESLAEDGYASETRAVTARANLQAAEAGVEAAQTELSRLEIRAPFSGILETDTAEIGSLLQPGGLCATVIQLNPIKLVGFVPEIDVNHVTVGAAARATLATGQSVEGEVTFLSRAADTLTRTFRVEIAVPNEDLEIRDGQTARITIASEGQTAHLLPQSALTLNNEGTLGVRLVGAQDRTVFAPVVFLRDSVEGVWLAGLPEQASVLVRGQEYVTDGVLLDVTYLEADQ